MPLLVLRCRGHGQGPEEAAKGVRGNGDLSPTDSRYWIQPTI